MVIILKDAISKAPVAQEQKKEKQELLTILNEVAENPQLLTRKFDKLKLEPTRGAPHDKDYGFAAEQSTTGSALINVDLAYKTPDSSRSSSPYTTSSERSVSPGLDQKSEEQKYKALVELANQPKESDKKVSVISEASIGKPSVRGMTAAIELKNPAVPKGLSRG